MSFLHMKPLLSLGFVCGVAPWIIKIVDNKLPQSKKEQFDVWVDSLTPRVSAWKPNDLYLWARNNRRQYNIAFVLFVLAFTLIAAPPTPTEFGAGYSTPVSLFFGVVTDAVVIFVILWFTPFEFDIVFKEESLNKAFQVFWRVCLGNIGVLILLIAVPRCFCWLVHVPLDPLPKYFLLYILGFGAFQAFMVYAPLVTLALLRRPVALVAHGMLWLSRHPQGAWAALVLALTTAFGLLKILF